MSDRVIPSTSSRRRGLRRQSWVVLLLSAPAFALMAVFLLWPTIQSVRFSAYDWNGLSAGEWVGLGNYRELFRDGLFRSVIANSLTLAVAGTVGAMAIGILWAYGIERRLPGWRAYRFLLFIPVIMPMTVSALLWNLLLDPTGPVNSVANDLGFDNPPLWLGDPDVAMWVVVCVAIWQASGFTMLIILGAMEDVPGELHDAGALDGAGSMRRLFSIVTPYIRGTIATLTIVQFVSLLKAFDLVFALTKGGPGNSTDIMGTYLVEKAFDEARYGYGSAVAVAMTVIMFTISFFLYRRLLGKDDAQ
ncbi:ABC transporter permease subunit [Streptomyces sp. 3MP-14]|uniref:ABC transporter permease subunit n=1 Tax=Streptomyces mimosae TaxID=2586635 RepID=A0A5N6ABX2_9ACTN|nr:MULTISPECIES: sugar ABC transporter permease [Streptomyces]KAB8166327.1 ABC transporter permease subunit [Streptomyces mimosae]KAB8174120.1 ABC transporter permease subunit [Streptomyces sp. 3MP-14]